MGNSSGFSEGSWNSLLLAADQHLAAVAFHVEFLVGAFGEDLAETVAGQDHAAGRLDGEAEDLHADAHFEVGAHQDGPLSGDFELHVLQDRLGASRGGHAGGHLEGVQQFVAFACRFHGWFYLSSLNSISSISVTARMFMGRTALRVT